MTAEGNQQQQQQNNPQAQAQEEHIADPPRQRTSNADLLALIVENGQKAEYARQIVEAELLRDAFDQDWRLARVFAMSGVFKDINGTTPNQAIATAMTKIRMGRSWGISEADAMQFIYFTNGRPAVMNELVAAKMREAGFDWDVQWHEATNGNRKVCVGCTLWLKIWDAQQKKFVSVLDREGKPVSEGFTKEDADVAMIWEKGQQIPLSQKWNFVSWARDMYFWRSIGRLKKYHCTNVLRGAYTQAEADDIAASQPPATVTSRNNNAAAAEEIRQTHPPDNDPRWYQPGEPGDMAKVAAKRIEDLTKQVTEMKQQSGEATMAAGAGQISTENGESQPAAEERKASGPKPVFGRRG